jgi:hypothetical protein
MSTRFVITEFFRNPDEDYEIVKIWRHKNTGEQKRKIEIHGKFCMEIFFDNEGLRHRDFQQPAYLDSNGRLEFWVHGHLHNGQFEPAIIHSDGRKEYWVYGEKRSETATLKKTHNY